MRLTSILNFRLISCQRASTFDKHFPAVQSRPKAWEGQDKDKFFRDKYAHVHADQLKRETSRKLKPSYSNHQRGRTKHLDKSLQSNHPDGQREIRFKVPPRTDKEESEETYYRHKVSPRLDSDPLHEVVYGKNSVLAALRGTKRSSYTKLQVTAKEERYVDDKVVKIAKERKTEIEYGISKHDMNNLTSNGVHNGYALTTKPIIPPDIRELDGFGATYKVNQLVYNKPEWLKLDVVDKHIKCNALGVYIDEVTDTHNMGAIIRTAYYLGADFVVFSEKNCAPLSPVVAKAAVGALDLLPIYNAPEPLDFFERTVKNGWNVVAAMPDYVKIRARRRVEVSRLSGLLDSGPCLLVLGSEGEGLRQSLALRCTHGTAIIARGSSKIDSLNVSVAAALVMSRFFAPQVFDYEHPHKKTTNIPT